MMKCPNGCGCEFTTTITEPHVWVVNSSGEFVEVLVFADVFYKHSKDTIWTCRSCGAEAVKDTEGGK